ncbi:MAG: GldG family protein [Byssovorax sp.]
MERKTKAATQTGIYLLIVAAILVVANVISFSVYKRFDTTALERFSLSKGSARLVRDGLDKELQADVYVTRGLPKFETFIQDLTNLMDEYERASNGHFKYTIIEAKTDEERKAAKEAGLQEAAFGEGSKTGKDQALISKGFMGIAFKYGSEKEQIPMLQPEQAQGLEFWITNKIRDLRDRADNKTQKFGIITGKDEIKLTEANLMPSQGRGGGPNIKQILEQAFPFYKFEDVDLQNGDTEINKELLGLIVTQPGKDYTEKELRRIDQFVMLGNKAVVFFTGAVNVKSGDASMKAELNTHGLEKLLDGYGIEMKKEAIFDWARHAEMQLMGQQIRFPAAPLAVADGRLEPKDQFLDQRFPGFFRLPQLVFPFASTLVAHAEKQPSAAVKVVARTSPKATVVTTDTVDMKLVEFKAKGDFGQRAMAIAVEAGCCDGTNECSEKDPCKAGTIKSAFGGKEGEGISTSAESKGPSRILVIASSQFLANPFARAGNAPPMPPQMQMMGPMGGDEDLMTISQPYASEYLTGTILTFKNTLDWMASDADLIAVSAKLLGESSLTYLDIAKPMELATDPEQAKKQADEADAEQTTVQQKVQWTLTLLPALLFALFGILRWRWRESARANLTLD